FTTSCGVSGCPAGSVEVNSTTCALFLRTYQCRRSGIAGTAQCSSCPPGRYGPNCAQCPNSGGQVCSGRGTCSDGINGSGSCSCFVGSNGPMCQYSNQVTCNGHGIANYDGSCSCNVGFAGRQCNACAAGYFGFPNCRFCNAAPTCNNGGTCDGLGNCACNANRAGANCQVCATNYYGYPTCTFCQSATTCNGRGSCNAVGGCVC